MTNEQIKRIALFWGLSILIVLVPLFVLSAPLWVFALGGFFYGFFAAQLSNGYLTTFPSKRFDSVYRR